MSYTNELITKALPAFYRSLAAQLEEDEKRWGDEWKRRPREGQEDRIFARFDEYLRDHQRNPSTVRVPWLKVAGLALIAWWREVATFEQGDDEEVGLVARPEGFDPNKREPVGYPASDLESDDEDIPF